MTFDGRFGLGQIFIDFFQGVTFSFLGTLLEAFTEIIRGWEHSLHFVFLLVHDFQLLLYYLEGRSFI